MFDEAILRHAPWSISKANLVDLCAKQFRFKYVEKKKETVKSTSSRIGVALHTLQEEELKSPGQHLTDIADKLAVEGAFTTEERREILTRIPAIVDFATRIRKFKADNGVTPENEFIEYKLAMSTTFSKTHFFDNTGLLRGVLDHGMVTRDNVMIVLDHKSGRKKKIEEHSTQFFAYMLMVMANFPIDAVQCGINYIGTDKVDWFPKTNGDSGVWTRSDVSKLRLWLSHYLNKSARKLTEIESGTVTPSTGWQCEYCGYVDSCEVGSAEVKKRRDRRDGGSPNL